MYIALFPYPEILLFAIKQFPHILKNKFISVKWHAAIVVLLAVVLSLWKKGSHDLQEWDESRNGVNAYEMYHNGDLINLHYDGKLDTWNAKPPLMIWLIVASYNTFGFNEFALRLPVTACAIFFFVVIFCFVRFFDDTETAFRVCILLMSCKAILGNHIGLTADFDMMLVLFLTASAFAFAAYVGSGKPVAIVLAAIFTALAFYTKGPACLVLIPGFILYLIVKRRTRWFFTQPAVYLSVLLFLLVCASWFLLVAVYGKSSDVSFYGSRNSIETMLVHDTFRRLTNSDFDHSYGDRGSHLFFFEVLDARMNLWNYLFYCAILLGATRLFRSSGKWASVANEERHCLATLSVCLILPLSVVLSFAATKHNWYLAPIFFFVAYVTVKAINYLGNRSRLVYPVIIGLALFSFGRHVAYLHQRPTDLHACLSNNQLLENQKIIVATPLKQNILLYLNWLNVTRLNAEQIPENQDYSGQLMLIRKEDAETLENDLLPLFGFDDYCVSRIKKQAGFPVLPNRSVSIPP